MTNKNFLLEVAIYVAMEKITRQKLFKKGITWQEIKNGELSRIENRNKKIAFGKLLLKRLLEMTEKNEIKWDKVKYEELFDNSIITTFATNGAFGKMEFEIEFSENPLVTDNPLGRLNIEYNFYKNSYITFYMPNVPGGRESHIEVLMKGGWGEDPVTRREKRNYGNYHLLMKLYKSILFSK